MLSKLSATKDESTGRWEIQGLQSSADTFDEIVKLIREEVRFSFARYGDGELFCMSGKVGRNCDKHEYFPDLGKRLRAALFSEPEYMVGIQPLSIHGKIYERIPGMDELRIHWYNADAIHNASIDGRLHELINACSSRYTIIVGPIHLAYIFDDGIHIIVPSLNCWNAYEDVKKNISFHLEKSLSLRPVILFCASMMTEVLIDDFHHRATCIDMGSALDPYCGILSRSYHHKLNIKLQPCNSFRQ